MVVRIDGARASQIKIAICISFILSLLIFTIILIIYCKRAKQLLSKQQQQQQQQKPRAHLARHSTSMAS